ncbi:MAG: serine/threonine protein kinase, partial [Myxococcota bacterium]|nr:serine/threonine protein kinase [Myxococcota bacterium]
MPLALPRGAQPVRSGAVLAGRYEIVRPLGSGGMGSVLEAIDIADGAPVALKLLHRELASDPVHVERFVREGQALAGLEHPAIVRVRACGPLEDGGLFLAMDLVRGETLQRFLRRRGPMSVETLGPIVRDLALGLFYAHERGVVHRDLKPSNVMLVAARDADAPTGATLIDFGVATSSGASRLTQVGEYVGTPRYMAPEQLSGTSTEDARADLYALGVVAYEALAGDSPFPCDAGLGPMMSAVLRGESAPLRVRRPDVPPALAHVIARAMTLRPEHRFATALELLDAWDGAVRPLDRAAPATIPMAIVAPSSAPPRHSFVRTRPGG